MSSAGGSRGHTFSPCPGSVTLPAGPTRGSVLTPGWAVSWRLALPSLERLVVLRRLEPGVARHPAARWRPLRAQFCGLPPGACPRHPCRSQAPALSSFSRPHRSASMGMSAQLCPPQRCPLSLKGPCSGRSHPARPSPWPRLSPAAVAWWRLHGHMSGLGSLWPRWRLLSVAVPLRCPRGAASAAVWSVSRLNDDPVAVRAAHSFCVHPAADGRLSCPHLESAVRNAAAHIRGRALLWTRLRFPWEWPLALPICRV